MKILAIDTATEACSAALLVDQRINSSYVEMDRGHAERVLVMVDTLLKQEGLRLADLDVLAFGRGPGGFTGVRLAASVTQGLAFGSRKMVVPVSDLQAVAQHVLDTGADVQSVLVCNDARMQEVYWACYRRGPTGLASLVGAEQVTKPSSVVIPTTAPGPIEGAGRGFKAYPELRERPGASLRAVHDMLLPRANEIARLALAEYAAGHAQPPEKALPVYLRDDVARPSVTRPT